MVRTSRRAFFYRGPALGDELSDRLVVALAGQPRRLLGAEAKRAQDPVDV